MHVSQYATLEQRTVTIEYECEHALYEINQWNTLTVLWYNRMATFNRWSPCAIISPKTFGIPITDAGRERLNLEIVCIIVKLLVPIFSKLEL